MNSQEYNLNIRPGVGIPPIVRVSQNDAGRPLAFKMYDGASALTIASGTTIEIHGTKRSGLGFTEACTWSGSTVSVDTTEAMTQESGAIPTELVFTSGTDVIASANFMLVIEPSPHSAAVTDGTVAEAINAVTRCETYAQAAEDAAADAASDAAEAAETAVNALIATIPADYTGLSTQVATNTADIGDLKADLEDLYDYAGSIGYDAIKSETYPTGWRAGYYTVDEGVFADSENFICTADYLDVSKCNNIKVTPPTDRAVAVTMYDANHAYLGIVGHANTTKHPENKNVELNIDVSEVTYVMITAGRYKDLDVSTILNDEYISGIGFYNRVPTVAENTERIDALETDINTLADLLAKESVQEYTDTEASDVISRIRALQTGNTLTFALVTDIHYGSTDTTYGLNTETQPYMLDHTIANINYVSKYVKYDFLVNLGDNTDGDSDPETQNELDDVVNKKLGLLGIPYLYTGGNHDTNIYYNSGSDIRTPAEMYAYLYSLMRGVTAHTGTYGNDWYLDLDNLGIRIIGLTANYGYKYRFSGTTELSTWLESVLDSTKINLILTHLSTISTQNWNGQAPNRSAYARDVIQTFVDNGGTVIQLCGHSHGDYSFTSPWLTIFSNCTKFFQADLTGSSWSAVTGYDSLGIVNPERVSGEASEDCWTTVILNPEERKIDFVRFGAGSDRSYTF